MSSKNIVTAPLAETVVIKKGEPLKNMLNADSLSDFALTIKSAYEPFPADEFVKSVMDDSWKRMPPRLTMGNGSSEIQRRPKCHFANS